MNLLLPEVKVALLDRDGVLNRKSPEGQYVCNTDQLELLPGAAEAVGMLNRNGVLAIVLTNQRAVARGLMTELDLHAVHELLKVQLSEFGAYLDAIYYCPHDYNRCHCRKPDIGMLEQAFRDFPVAARSNTVLIGDSLSDIQAGRAFGVHTILVDEKARYSAAESLADFHANSLLDAVKLMFSDN